MTAEAQTGPDWPVWGWPDRRRFDLRRSHRLAEYLSPSDREHAERLIDEIVEYEALARAVERSGGSGTELERIEDACWPVREVLRQLDERMPVFMGERPLAGLSLEQLRR